MASNNKIEIVLSVKDDGSTRKIGAASASVRDLGTSGVQAGKGLAIAQNGVQSLAQSLGTIRNLAAGAFAANQISNYASSFITTADAMRNMDQRLLLVSKNTNDYAAAQRTVKDVAAASHQSLGDVNTLYSRMAQATANLNVSQTELASVTKTVALSVALSGSSASEASAGLQQFAQAMGSSRLGGDELRSVLENMPQLTKVFVDAAGGSMATLRTMAEAGKLTTEWMIEAIKQAAPEIEKLAAGMPLTVGKAMTDLKNSASLYIDEVNRTTGFTSTLAGAISVLGNNLETVANGGVAVLGVGLSILAYKGMSSLTVMSAEAVAAIIRLGTTTTAAAFSMATLSTTAATSTFSLGTLATGIMGLSNPIGWVTLALGAGVTAWALWESAGEAAAKGVAKELAETGRMNKALKEISDPDLKLNTIGKQIREAEAEIEGLRVKMREPFGEMRFKGDFDAAIYKLNRLEENYTKTQENMALVNQQRGAKEIAVDMSVADYRKKIQADLEKATADSDKKAILDLEARKAKELEVVRSTFKAKSDDVNEQKAAAENIKAISAEVEARYEKERAYIVETSKERTKANKAEKAEAKDTAKELADIYEYKMRMGGLEVDRINALIAAEEELSVAAMTEGERAVYAIELKYAALDKLIEKEKEAGNNALDWDAVKAKIDLRQQEDLNKLVEKTAASSDQISKIWEHAYENLQDITADWLYDMEISWDSLKDLFKKTVSQMVSAWLWGQANMKTTAAVAGAAGITGAATTASAATGSTGGLGGIGGMISSVSGVYSSLSNGAMMGMAQRGVADFVGSMGASKMAVGILEMSSNAFGVATMGIGSAVMGLLSGQDFKTIAKNSAFTMGGAALGSIIPGVGTVIGGVVGGLVGSLFGGKKENTFTISELEGRADKTWNRDTGFDAMGSAGQWAGGNAWYKDIQNTYTSQRDAATTAFNEQVSGLKSQMSATAWDAFASSLENSNVNFSASGRWKLSDAQSALTSSLEGFSASLNTMLNTALAAALPVLGNELKATSAYALLNASTQSSLSNIINSGSFDTTAYAEWSTYLANITSVTSVIDEVVANSTLTDYEISLKGINAQFDTYAATLTAAGVDLGKYTALEEARAIAIGDLVDGIFDKMQSALDRMNLDTEAFAADKRTTAMAALDSALQAARSGDLTKANNLDQPLSILTTSNKAQFATAEEYQRDFWSTYLKIAEIKNLSSGSLSSFAVGTDYVPRDMTANIHRGERITPAAYNRSDATNADLVAEVKQLREDLTRAMYEIARNTGKTADQLTRWEYTGMPAVTTI